MNIKILKITLAIAVFFSIFFLTVDFSDAECGTLRCTVYPDTPPGKACVQSSNCPDEHLCKSNRTGPKCAGGTKAPEIENL